MTLAEINQFDAAAIQPKFLECCGSQAWAACMVSGRPFSSVEYLRQYANEKWWDLTEADWLEAFSKHPRIGESRQLSKWSTQEQSGMSSVEDQTVTKLAVLNDAYFEKFGWIYIVCATGKSGAEMLTLLDHRILNEEQEELRIAAQEQAKIMDLRIGKLLTE